MNVAPSSSGFSHRFGPLLKRVLVYGFKKAILVLPLLFGVITLLFLLIELSPGSVVDRFITEDTTPEVRERLMAKWQLDQPIYVRYFSMMRNVAVLDFGVSIGQERPVFDIVAEALPNTILLSIITLCTLYPVGILIGILQGTRQGKPADTALSVGSLFFYSMPSFWLALMLQLVFCYLLPRSLEGIWPTTLTEWGWKPSMLQLPSSGMYDVIEYEWMTPTEQVLDRIKHVLLPGLAMGVAHAAGIARYMRSSLLEVIRQDFVRTARAKGLPERMVIFRHAVRNALLPVVTLFGLSLPMVFSGSVLVESIFAWPGMGRLIVSAIFAQDTPLIVACFFIYTLVVAFGSLLADVSYALVDPRIRFDE